MESMPTPAMHSDSELHYPTLYIDGAKGESPKLPDEGEMTIKFRKVSESQSKGKDGSRFSIGLDVIEICSVKGGPKEDEGESGEDALDRLKKEAESGEEDDGEPEED